MEKADLDFFELMENATGKRLNSTQSQAVLHTDHPLLLLASPGSGKTTTLNFKIAYLILRKNVSPDTILALTFSRASAKDMKERFEQLFHGMIDVPVKFSTIHSFAYKIVREYFQKSNMNYTLIEGNTGREESKSDNPIHKNLLLRKIYRDINNSNITDDEMDNLVKDIGYAKNKMILRRDASTIQSTVQNFADIYVAYEAFKQRVPSNLLLDFDDMLSYAYGILKRDKNILTKYQNTYKYVLTDESQDTSLIQHRIIQKLAEPENNICVVADDDQSIYGWRGSEVEELLTFGERYPNAVILKMEQNYRSSKNIVRVANQFIKRNKKRYDKNMFTENEMLDSIVIHRLATYDAEIAYLVDCLKSTDARSGTAVLYRNHSSSIEMMNALDKAGISFYIKDSDNKFFRHFVLNDVLNFLHFSNDTSNVSIFETIHTKFNGYVTKWHVEQIREMDNRVNVLDNLMKVNGMKDYQMVRLMTAKSVFESIKLSKPKQAIQTIRIDLGYEKALRKISEHLGFNADNLFGILDTLERIADGLPTIDSFFERINHLEKLQHTAKLNKHKNAVTLSTLHSSKGLEFDNVYMTDLVSGVIPTADTIADYAIGKKDDMEEAVRLFYVGMTRARYHLELLSYKQKGNEATSESTFVSDVRKILYSGSTATGRGKSPIHGKSHDAPSITIQAGELVRHKKFGDGKVTAVEDDTVQIKFTDGNVKQFSLLTCVENNLLSKTHN
jgi:DNA helicase II / ATP-dependent DNA helicase PcrA